jgi:hypothetical protein
VAALDEFADGFLRLPRPAAGSPRHDDPSAGFLPTSAGGRLVAGLLSAALLPLAAGFLFALAVGPAGNNPGWWLARAALWEFCLALLAVCGCGLAWAVAAPGWLPPLAWRYGRRLSLLLVVPYLVIGGWAVWPLG